jgi:L,D-transpeptidase ErfK/SrfK
MSTPDSPEQACHHLSRRNFREASLLVMLLFMGACATQPDLQTASGPGARSTAVQEERNPENVDPSGAEVDENLAENTFSMIDSNSMVGDVAAHTTKRRETLLDIARRYDLGYTQLVTANPGRDPWNPGVGSRITVPRLYILPPGPRRGIVINLVQQRLFYFPPGGGSVQTFPIGTGILGHSTPLKATQIVAKEPDPTWVPPASIRRERPWLPASIPPGPDNPLGHYALHLGLPLVLIHGTNKPYGVGRNVSHGCIRLYPEDIERLFHEVRVGMPVRVINEEFETAWVDGDLYVAVFPNKEQTDELDEARPMTPAVPAGFEQRIAEVAGDQADRVDWDAVRKAAEDRSGIPVRVTQPVIASAETGS